MKKSKLREAIAEHNATMAQIVEKAAQGHITMLEAAMAQGDEIRRFRLALRESNIG